LAFPWGRVHGAGPETRSYGGKVLDLLDSGLDGNGMARIEKVAKRGKNAD
jgi:hypothetical protein